MYITTSDMLAVMLALTISIVLVITTAVANYRMTARRDYWRDQYNAFLEERD